MEREVCRHFALCVSNSTSNPHFSMLSSSFARNHPHADHKNSQQTLFGQVRNFSRLKLSHGGLSKETSGGNIAEQWTTVGCLKLNQTLRSLSTITTHNRIYHAVIYFLVRTAVRALRRYRGKPSQIQFLPM